MQQILASQEPEERRSQQTPKREEGERRPRKYDLVEAVALRMF